MMLRLKLIARLPLAKCDTSITPKAFQQRINAHIRDLCEDVPALIRLRASRIELRHELLSTGMWLEFYLEELPQMALQFPTDRSERSLLTDLFLQDVALVEGQQKEIRQRIARAISPAIDPSGNVDVVNIRRRLKKGRNTDGFLLPNGPEPELVSYDNLPKVMPRGLAAQACVRVNWLSPKQAEVTIREVVNLEGDDTISLKPNTRIKLLRLGTHRRPESGRRLQQAMDTNCNLVLRVTVAFNWVSGEPLYLELLDFAE